MKKQPNIIIINPDEMRWDTMGHMGNPAACTPRLDEFAQNDAVSFEYAYCQNPVCVPSRCSFLTGLYPHVHGFRTMHYLIKEGKDTMFAELRRGGYTVWNNARNDFISGTAFGQYALQVDELQTPNRDGLPRHRVSSDFPYSHYIGVVDGTLETADMRDTVALCERIRKIKPEDKPLCAFVGLVNPHCPYITDREHFDRIDPEKIRDRVLPEETSGKSEMINKLREFADLSNFPEQNWKDLQRIYLAMSSYVDDMFGMIVDTLKETGLYDDTVIIFMSDHGDWAGDFNLPEKAQNCFEDVLTRVPLLIKPAKTDKCDPGKTKSLAELVDFYATVMDYAGVEPGHDQFGVSLRPVIENRETPNRRYVFSEGGRRACEKQADEYHKYGEDGPPKAFDYWAKLNAEKDDLAHEKGTMIFDGKFKYIMRLSGKDEFYDMKKDPLEKKNEINNPEYEKEILRLKLEMLKWYQETCDVVPRGFDIRQITPCSMGIEENK